MGLTKKNKKIESLILGAGQSIRMKGDNKLLKRYRKGDSAIDGMIEDYTFMTKVENIFHLMDQL